ncbi:DNA polymerase I [Vibrio phage vB_ValS_PJ32]|nr:DNA polymerase I [Vibrio phage vB_ValS_PJ32]
MLYLMVGERTTLHDLKRVVAPVVKAQGIPHRIMRWTEGEPTLGQGDVLFSMGKAAFDHLTRLGVYPKNRTVTSFREKPQLRGQGHVLCSYDAAIGRVKPEHEAFLQIDIMQACRMHQTGTIKPQLGSYRWVDDFSEMIEEIEQTYTETGKPVRVAGDLETVGFDYVAKDKFIVSAQFSHKEGMADLVRFYSPEKQPKPGDLLHDQITWLLNSEKVILCGANFKYDLNWIKYKWGIECTNFKLDTTLVGSLLNENRSNSLNTHAKLFTHLGGYDDDLNTTFDKGRMDLIPNENLLPYAGGDTDATLRVRNVFARELQQDRLLTNFYVNLLHPASRAFEKMEQNGVKVNAEKLEKLGEELEQEKNQYLAEMFAMMPRPLALKYRGETRIKSAIVKDYLFGARGLGLKPVMFSEKNHEPLTNKSHLNNFDDPEKYPEAHKFIQLVNKWNQADKAQGTYCRGFLKHRREDGYFHPSYMLFKGAFENASGTDDSGTVTGRLAAKDPAIQTLPKKTSLAKRLRACYEPPEGYSIVEIDFSQGELRVCAVMANEPAMKQAYNEGLDLHVISGGATAGLTYEQMIELEKTDAALYKKYRNYGKPQNFGLLYGMSWGGFQTYAKDQYGILLSDREAQNMRFNFFDTYARLPDWHEETKEFARQYGYIRSPLGRVRHLPLINSRDNFLRSQAERQAVNSGVQSTLSDLLIYGMARFRAQYGDPDEVRFMAMIHDALVSYIKTDQLSYWIPILQAIMQDTEILYKVFGWEVDIPFIADAEHSETNFAEMREYKEAA